MKRQRVRSEVYRARRLVIRKKSQRWARRFPVVEFEGPGPGLCGIPARLAGDDAYEVVS